MMQLGCDGVFVGSGIFKSGEAAKRAKAIVQAVTHFRDGKILAEVSSGLGVRAFPFPFPSPCFGPYRKLRAATSQSR